MQFRITLGERKRKAYRAKLNSHSKGDECLTVQFVMMLIKYKRVTL